jgi:hypothetical protein
MNKKELADNLDIGDALNIADHLSQGYLEWCPEAEWVLRAQHARIEELEAMLRQFGLAESIIKQQQLEIEALKDEVAEWKMSYENSIRFEGGYGHN